MPRCWQSWLFPWSAIWPSAIRYTLIRWQDWDGPPESSLSFGWWRSFALCRSPSTRASPTWIIHKKPELIWPAVRYQSRLFALCWWRRRRPNGPWSRWPPSYSSLYPWVSCASSISASASKLRPDARHLAAAAMSKVVFIIQTNRGSRRRGGPFCVCSVSNLTNSFLSYLVYNKSWS